MKIALIGTDGIPARYGGFETFVEQVAPQLVTLGHQVMVVGSSIGRSGLPPVVPGVRVVNLPLRANGASSVLYDLVSFFCVVWWADAVVLLGVSAGLFTPLFCFLARGSRLVINVDGLESRRQKWAGLKGKFLALSEKLAVRFATRVVSDNKAIADLLAQRYGRESSVIAYGGDHVLKLPLDEAAARLFCAFGLLPGSYAFTVARIEPENNIGLMIEGFLASRQPLYVIVGNFKQTEYGRGLQQRYAGETRVRLVDSNYDPALLASLRGLCAVYLHGHSVGGTNPSLVEMLPYGCPILAWDCSFNRHTLQGSGWYFGSASSLSEMLDAEDRQASVPPVAVQYAAAYRWAGIARMYSDLLGSIAP